MDGTNKAKQAWYKLWASYTLTLQQVSELRAKHQNHVLVKDLLKETSLSEASVYRYLNANQNTGHNPQSDWPETIVPAFPFPYFRFQEFIDGVKKLARGHSFHYREYDWGKKELGAIKTINPESIVIVEGVSVLCVELLPYYAKKILVLSNRDNELKAIAARESAENLVFWRNLYLPSVEHYWQTKPWNRADILYTGRGITDKSILEKSLFDQ